MAGIWIMLTRTATRQPTAPPASRARTTVAGSRMGFPYNTTPSAHNKAKAAAKLPLRAVWGVLNRQIPRIRIRMISEIDQAGAKRYS